MIRDIAAPPSVEINIVDFTNLLFGVIGVCFLVRPLNGNVCIEDQNFYDEKAHQPFYKTSGQTFSVFGISFFLLCHIARLPLKIFDITIILYSAGFVKVGDFFQDLRDFPVRL